MSKGRATRDQILKHALSEASRFGLEGLSIGALAKDVGMSKSGLFAHFGSKEGLQISVLGRAADLYIDNVVLPAIEEPRGEPRVRALFANWLDWTDSVAVPGGCLFMSAAFEFEDRQGAVRDTLVVQIQLLQDALRRAAAIAVEEAHFRQDLDLDLFAFNWHALLLGYHIQGRLLHVPAARTMAVEAFDRLVRSARAAHRTD